MNWSYVAAAWVLVTLDAALMAYRLAMGRSGLLDKRRMHQQASARGVLYVQPAIIATVALTLLLIRAGGPGLASAFDESLRRFLTIGGTYAALILGTSLLCLVPSPTVRSAASVMVFGPFTLARPAVVVVTVAWSVLPDPRWQLVVVGLAIALPGVLVEPYLDRRIARRTVDDACAPRPAAKGARPARDPTLGDFASS